MKRRDRPGWPVVVALVLLGGEILYFLPMLAGWHAIPWHAFDPLFTGIEGRRDLPPPLRWLPGHDASGILLDYPCEYYSATRVRQGAIPWWNPLIGCGRAGLGSGQMHPFSPLLLPFFLNPTPYTYSLQLVLGSLISLLGAFWFFRLLGATELFAALGAGLWTWNPLVHSLWLMDSIWAVWFLPWALGGVLYALERRQYSGWLIASAALALMPLCGHVETSAYMAEMVGLFSLSCWVGYRRELRLRFLILGMGALVLLAALMSCAQWYPLLEVLKDADSYKFHDVAGANQIASAFTYLGDPLQPCWLMPGLWALASLTLRRRAGAAVAGLWLMLLFCLCLYVPVLSGSLPFRLLRLGGILPPLHGAELAVLPLSALALAGVLRLAGPAEDRPARSQLAGAAGLCIALSAWSLSHLWPLANGLWIPFLWIGLVALLCTAVFLQRPARTAWLVALLLAAMLYPLAAFQFRYPDFDPSPQPDWRPLLHPEPPAQDRPAHRFWAESSKGSGAPYLMPDLGILSGLSDVRSAQVLNTPGSSIFQPGEKGYLFYIIYRFSTATPELLSFLDVDRVAVKSPSPGRMFQVSDLTPGPRAFVVPGVIVEGDDQACLKAFREMYGARRLYSRAIVLGDPVRKLPDALTREPARDASGDVRWLSWSPEKFSLAVDVRGGPGFVVVLDATNHLWRATVDSQSADLFRTDVMFMGVPVPPGRHRIDFEYDTRQMKLAIVASLLGWLGFFGWLWVLKRPGGTKR